MWFSFQQNVPIRLPAGVVCLPLCGERSGLYAALSRTDSLHSGDSSNKKISMIIILFNNKHNVIWTPVPARIHPIMRRVRENR
ncbi:hypothetical protein Dda3937_02902 [Dickeya dadantii 3937]|uniref:Uncharacterized protein n=1 Tax=Dickeya dadantii (strain 3937) TaxID=198628 RepID=E0SL17_DICD3|nr:hypothetical protein Dda3937_02902 [Dickeya dadantii 3937]